VLLVALCSVGFACSAAAGEAGSQPTRTLRNAKVGYSLTYPRGWKITRLVQATEFAGGANCQSVRVVDFKPPSDAGRGAILQSFVQACWKRRSDGLSLERFMRKTYGARLPAFFARARFGGVPAYRARDRSAGDIVFLQNAGYRLQVVAAVVASPAKRATRLAQVRKILASLSLAR
jgi:hypothetical protein